MDATISARAMWESLYVIVGSSGGALIGLQSVVVTLLADRRHGTTAGALNAFASPTVVHLTGALAVSAIMSAVALARGCSPSPSAQRVSPDWRTRPLSLCGPCAKNCTTPCGRTGCGTRRCLLYATPPCHHRFLTREYTKPLVCHRNLGVVAVADRHSQRVGYRDAHRPEQLGWQQAQGLTAICRLREPAHSHQPRDPPTGSQVLFGSIHRSSEIRRRGSVGRL